MIRLKNRKSIILICMIAVVILVFAICRRVSNGKSSEDGTFTIDYGYWNEMGSSGKGTDTLTDIKSNDIVFDDGFGTFTVKSVSPEKIVISIEGGGFTKKEGAGINLRAKPLKTITIKKGESLTIASQTMDAGVTLTFRYE